MTALSDAQRRSRARVASVRRRPRRLRHGRRRGGARARALDAGAGAGRDDLRRGRRLRPQRRRVPHHRTVSRRRRRRRRACNSRSTTPASTPADDRARERARHVDAAQRRGRGRSDPQGLRRRRAAGHVDQGRDRAPDRRGRRGRGRRVPARDRATASVPPTANLEQLGDDIGLDVVAGSPREIAPEPALSNSFGFGGHNASLVIAPPRRSLVTTLFSPTRRAGDRRAQRRGTAELREIDGRPVAWFRVAGGKHHGAIGVGRSGEPSSGRCASASSSASRSSASSTTSGAELRRRRRRAPRLGSRRRAGSADASGVVPTCSR